MQFTVMPKRPSSCAICRVNPICPALALVYAWMPVRVTLRPAPDEMFTIRPHPADFIAGTTARVQRNVVVRLASKIAFQSSSLIWRRLTDEGGGDPRLCPFWHDDPGYARPREVFHPRAVRGLLLVALDDLPDARRVPPVVEEDLHARLARLGEPLAQRARRRRVPAVAVDDGDAAEALPVQRVQEVAQDRDVRARAQRRAAGERSEVRGHAERQRWEDRHPEWLGRLDRDALGQDRVGADRQIAVLLRRSDGHHDPVVVREIFLEHLPVAVVDPHERTSP